MNVLSCYIAVLIIVSFIIIILRRQYKKKVTSSVTIIPVNYTGTTDHTGSSDNHYIVVMDDKGTIDKKSEFVQEDLHNPAGSVTEMKDLSEIELVSDKGIDTDIIDCTNPQSEEVSV